MKNKDSLGDRMKENYENRSKTYLTRKVPVIIRIDGKAFHSFTKDFQRPYDTVFHEAMNNTLKYLCENVQGCKFGYTQSDEITLVLTDYDTITTDAWFGYSVQKMCSISASMATLAFNRYFRDAVNKVSTDKTLSSYLIALFKARDKGAIFDSRCFSVPKEEVCNCLIWRQQDATRNAIQMLGQTYFSDKQLHGKSCDEIQDMLMMQKNINFNDMPIEFKRGVCCVRKPVNILCEDCEITRNKWVIDTEIPIFSQERSYIDNILRSIVKNKLEE